MTDIKSRLRALYIMDEVGSDNPLGREAAAYIERLEAALEPFAKVGDIIAGPFGPALFRGEDDAFQSGCAWTENGERKTLTWGDFRRAREARNTLKGGNDGD